MFNVCYLLEGPCCSATILAAVGVERWRCLVPILGVRWEKAVRYQATINLYIYARSYKLNDIALFISLIRKHTVGDLI